MSDQKKERAACPACGCRLEQDVGPCPGEELISSLEHAENALLHIPEPWAVELIEALSKVREALHG